MADPTYDEAADDARYEAREAGRDTRAKVAIVLHGLLALAPLAVGVFGRLSQGSHSGVEDAMGLYIVVVALSVPAWLIATIVALSSVRLRAIACCALYPIAWLVTMQVIR